MNKFVFISHAEKDRRRIRPILDALLAGGVRIWIDQPRAFGLHTHELVCGIPTDSRNWGASIQEALKAAAVIIVFWSKVSIQDDRTNVHEEARFALNQNKLIQVAIDAVIGRLPFGFSSAQVNNVFNEETADDASLDLSVIIPAVVERVAGTVMTTAVSQTSPLFPMHGTVPPPAFGPTQTSSQGGLPDFDDPLPYFVDRQPQLRDLVTELCLELDRGSAARTCVFLMRSTEVERPDRFIDYAYCEAFDDLKQSDNRGEDFKLSIKKFDWPDCGSGRDRVPKDRALQHCLQGLRKELALGAVKARDPTTFARHVADTLRPEASNSVVLFHCDIKLPAWSRAEEELLIAFLEWWGQVPLAEVRTRPVLLIKLIEPTEPPRRGLLGFFSSLPPTIEDFFRRIDAAQFEQQLRVVKLDPLDAILPRHVSDWAKVYDKWRGSHSERPNPVPPSLVREAAIGLSRRHKGKKPLHQVSIELRELMFDPKIAARLAKEG